METIYSLLIILFISTFLMLVSITIALLEIKFDKESHPSIRMAAAVFTSIWVTVLIAVIKY